MQVERLSLRRSVDNSLRITEGIVGYGEGTVDNGDGNNGKFSCYCFSVLSAAEIQAYLVKMRICGRGVQCLRGEEEV